MMSYNERGNVALTNGASAVLWVMDGDTAVKAVSYTPGDYPAWHLDTDCCISSEDLAEHINTNLQGWRVQKMNLEGVHTHPDGYVWHLCDCEEPEMSLSLGHVVETCLICEGV